MKKNLLMVIIAVFVVTTLWAGYVVEKKPSEVKSKKNELTINKIIAKTIELYKKQTGSKKKTMEQRIKAGLADYVKASYTEDKILLKTSIDNFKEMYDELSILKNTEVNESQAAKIIKDMTELLELLPDSLTLPYKLQIMSHLENQNLSSAENKLTVLANLGREYTEEVILNHPGYLKGKLDEFKSLSDYFQTQNDIYSNNIMKKIKLADLAYMNDDF